MTERKYIRVPELVLNDCDGCVNRDRRYSVCKRLFAEHPDLEDNCNRTIVIENTPEARAAYVALRLEASNGEIEDTPE